MKKKNGFTLIELLAVIIILGILMIIAIPSVTKYISDSRKSSYVDTAKEIVSGTRNKVNDGKLGMYDTSATYYIPSSYIKTENASKSPYGEFTEAYIAVIYDGKGYKYYWISVDDAGQGVKNITPLDKLDEDDIESDLTSEMIKNTVEHTVIGNRNKILILDPSDETWKEPVGEITSHVSEEEGGGSSGGSESGNGGNSGGNGGTTPVSNKICKRATSLHTATCSRTDSNGCRGNNKYANGATITYGNETTTSGTLTSGDAFDCDVNGNGKIDTDDGTENGNSIERFYYVSDYYDVNAATPGFDSTKATLIYYTNIENGTTPSQNKYAYDSSNENNHGPRTLLDQLPTGGPTGQWKNDQIIAPGTRQIRNEAGATTTNKGRNAIESFTYTDKAARLLTAQELVSACGLSKVGNYTTGELDSCNYLMENIGQYEGTSGAYGYWLESPHASYSHDVWNVSYYNRRVNSCYANSTGSYGDRPVITVLKSNISY